MKKLLLILFLAVICLSIIADIPLSKYENNKYNILMYFPSNFERMQNNNGIIFYNNKYGITFSLLFSESNYSPQEHIRSIEFSYGVENSLDSNSIYLSDAECDSFNVDIGVRSHFVYYKDMEVVNKSILAMKYKNIIYIIIVDFIGPQNEEIVNLINKCIATFRVTGDNE